VIHSSGIGFSVPIEGRMSDRLRRMEPFGLTVQADFRHSRRTGIEVSMLLHESNHGTQNGKNGPVH
jgi:hypothetical protein